VCLLLITESYVGFISVGVPRPTPSWGVMVADGQGLLSMAWRELAFAAICVILLAAGFYMLGAGSVTARAQHLKNLHDSLNRSQGEKRRDSGWICEAAGFARRRDGTGGKCCNQGPGRCCEISRPIPGIWQMRIPPCLRFSTEKEGLFGILRHG
jgi:hypothetical protein